MLASERRVVITGLGLITPLGIGPDSNWSAVAAGRGAVSKLRSLRVAGLPNDIGAEIADFDFKALALPRFRKSLQKSLKYMARDIQLAVAAAQLAASDAGLIDAGLDPTRIGIDLGAGLISTELDELGPAISLASAHNGEFDYHVFGRDGIPIIPPVWLLKYLPNMLACHISIMLDCQGPSNTITEAESASLLALGEATRIIACGRADVMISGGADSKIHPIAMTRMALLHQMTHSAGPPAAACRPFDTARDGFVPGEGAGIIILEEREHAVRRGARILGEILGFGSGADAQPDGGIDPEGIGVEIALRAALRDAHLDPAEVGHVNAHGFALPAYDLAEARAINRVFGGPDKIPVAALKGYFGNISSGAAAVELAISLLGVNRGLVPSTLNCEHPDPECGLDVTRGGPRPTLNSTFAKISLTRLGQAAALVVRGNPGTSAA